VFRADWVAAIWASQTWQQALAEVAGQTYRRVFAPPDLTRRARRFSCEARDVAEHLFTHEVDAYRRSEALRSLRAGMHPSELNALGSGLVHSEVEERVSRETRRAGGLCAAWLDRRIGRGVLQKRRGVYAAAIGGRLANAYAIVRPFYEAYARETHAEGRRAVRRPRELQREDAWYVAPALQVVADIATVRFGAVLGPIQPADVKKAVQQTDDAEAALENARAVRLARRRDPDAPRDTTPEAADRAPAPTPRGEATKRY